MSDTIDQRVSDIEALIADIPQMLSLRLEGITAAQHETTARVGFLDKQMAMLIRDMRDMRGGVTRQLVGQDGELAAIKDELAAIRGELAPIKDALAATRAELAPIKDALAETSAEFAPIKDEFAATRAEFAATKDELAATRAELAPIKSQLVTQDVLLSAIDAKLDAVLGRLPKT